jgi:hypothetical protein
MFCATSKSLFVLMFRTTSISSVIMGFVSTLPSLLILAPLTMSSQFHQLLFFLFLLLRNDALKRIVWESAQHTVGALASFRGMS